jgi:hypothetical protein
MKLLDAYSTTTRLKYTEPKLHEQFYPLPFDNRYIVFMSQSGMGGKNYPYWEEVFDIVKQFLGDIKILQLGGPNDITFRHVDLNICGKTNFYELCHLVKNASLSISGDTSLVHLASTYKIPLVALYGLTDPKISGGFFGDKDKEIYLEPDRKKFPLTFNPNDQSVANIKPEEVARAILKSLNIAAQVPLDTKHFGPFFLSKTLDVIPNMVVHPQQFPNSLLNIRGDIEFNEDGIYQNIANYRSTLIVSRPLNIDILKQVKPHIARLLYLLEDDHNLEFVKRLQKAGIPFDLASYKDQDWINQLKFDYADYGVIHKREYPLLPESCKIEGPVWFKTNKFILANGKVFLSIWHYKNNQPINNFNENFAQIPSVNELDWNRDIEYYWIYK